jgi:hypothetical protein
LCWKREKVIKRFGKLITASFIVMGIGLVTFLSTPLWLHYFDADTDIPGALIIDSGLIILIVGLILRRRLRGVKLAALVTLAAILSLPVLIFIASLIYYFSTGRELGW